MNILTKCELIEEFSKNCIEDGTNRDFIKYNDLGIPLAVAVVAEIADIKNDGTQIIDETYNLMCELLEIDKDKEYTNYDEYIADSNWEEDED